MVLKSRVSESEEREILRARDELWRHGILFWKLNTYQRSLYDFFHETKTPYTVMNASRRIGKSFTSIIIMLEMCLQNPNFVVLYVQPTKSMIRDNLIPDMEIMLEDCPLDIRPTFNRQSNTWIFKNGSRIKMAGTDNQHYNKLRGANANLCIVDEAGFCSDLKHIIDYVVSPLMLQTKGRILFASTTPTEPDHQFIDYIKEAKILGCFIKKTLREAIDECAHEEKPLIDESTWTSVVSRYVDGVEADAFRTEYMCEIITNSDMSVLPEWTEAIGRECVGDVERPMFYDIYAGMDIGFRDFTFLIFGYWDFDKQRLVIVDEYVQKQGTTKVLADNINEKERVNWTNPTTGEMSPIYRRVSDNNNLNLLEDLRQDHFLYFMPTQKHDKITYISQLRTMIANKQVIISPKCVKLLEHIQLVTWNKDKSDFKKSSDGGHYDGVAALLYLSRNIDRFRDPYPAGWRTKHITPFTHHSTNRKPDSFEESFKNALKPRTSFVKKNSKN